MSTCSLCLCDARLNVARLSVARLSVAAVNCRSGELSPFNCRAIKCRPMKCHIIQQTTCVPEGTFCSQYRGKKRKIEVQRNLYTNVNLKGGLIADVIATNARMHLLLPTRLRYG